MLLFNHFLHSNQSHSHCTKSVLQRSAILSNCLFYLESSLGISTSLLSETVDTSQLGSSAIQLNLTLTACCCIILLLLLRPDDVTLNSYDNPALSLVQPHRPRSRWSIQISRDSSLQQKRWAGKGRGASMTLFEWSHFCHKRCCDKQLVSSIIYAQVWHIFSLIIITDSEKLKVCAIVEAWQRPCDCLFNGYSRLSVLIIEVIEQYMDQLWEVNHACDEISYKGRQ